MCNRKSIYLFIVVWETWKSFTKTDAIMEKLNLVYPAHADVKQHRRMLLFVKALLQCTHTYKGSKIVKKLKKTCVTS